MSHPHEPISALTRSPPTEYTPPKSNKALAKRSTTEKVSGDDLPVYVTLDEVTKALAPLKPRPRVFLRFLFVTGARCSEALAVTVGDLDMRGSAVKLATLKRRRGKPQRAVPLTGDFLGELAVLITEQRLQREDKLFPWSRSRAFEIVRDALLAAGVDRPRAHPHSLRHGHAIHALRGGASLPAIQRTLGHRFIATTQIYLRVTGDDVRKEYERIKW